MVVESAMQGATRMRESTTSGRFAAMLLLLAMVMPPIAGAVLPPDLDAKETVFKLPAPSKHWVWVNDFVFPHMADGMAYLVDGDTGHGNFNNVRRFVRKLGERGVGGARAYGRRTTTQAIGWQWLGRAVTSSCGARCRRGGTPSEYARAVPPPRSAACAGPARAQVHQDRRRAQGKSDRHTCRHTVRDSDAGKR